VVKILLTAANALKKNSALERMLDRDRFLETALHSAVRSKSIETVQYVMQAWCDGNAFERSSATDSDSGKCL